MPVCFPEGRNAHTTFGNDFPIRPSNFGNRHFRSFPKVDGRNSISCDMIITLNILKVDRYWMAVADRGSGGCTDVRARTSRGGGGMEENPDRRRRVGAAPPQVVTDAAPGTRRNATCGDGSANVTMRRARTSRHVARARAGSACRRAPRRADGRAKHAKPRETGWG